MLDSEQMSEFETEIHSTGLRKHPEANTALFLGIAAIILAAGALGLACAVFSMIAASRTIRDFKEKPDRYMRRSYNKAIAGIVCSVVSIVILLIFVFFLVSKFNLLTSPK